MSWHSQVRPKHTCSDNLFVSWLKALLVGKAFDAKFVFVVNHKKRIIKTPILLLVRTIPAMPPPTANPMSAPYPTLGAHSAQ